jgi:hypothetical protein
LITPQVFVDLAEEGFAIVGSKRQEIASKLIKGVPEPALFSPP